MTAHTHPAPALARRTPRVERTGGTLTGLGQALLSSAWAAGWLIPYGAPLVAAARR
mgnify:CR=1 FL=1